MLEQNTLKNCTFYPTKEQYDFQCCKNNKKSGNSPKSALREPISFVIKQENIQTYTVQKLFHYPMFRVFFTILQIFVNYLTQFVSIWTILDAAVRWKYASSHFWARTWTLLSSEFSGNLDFFLKKCEKIQHFREFLSVQYCSETALFFYDS